MHAAEPTRVPGRDITALDGEWSLQIRTDPGRQHRVTVPGPWTTQVPGYGDSHESVRYTRVVTLDAPPSPDARAFLTFGGVNHSAQVAVNGIAVGEHEGGWTPFECEVTGALVAGANTIEVDVHYPPAHPRPGERGFFETAHGKQSWYGTTAGIWQSVALEVRGPAHVSDVAVRPAPDLTGFDVRVAVSTPDGAEPADAAPSTLTLRLTARDAAGTVVASTTTPVPPEPTATRLTIADPHLWDTADPHLYTLDVTLVADDVAVDHREVTSGLRSFEARDGGFWLNGRPVELRAVLDQDYHPGSSSIPRSDEDLEQLFTQVRELGFTMLRCHIKRPDARYYDLADRLGILVWAELPSWLTMTPAAAEAGEALLEEITRLDAHHPSIVIWTVMNESWGIDLADAGQRRWLRRTFDHAKSLVPHALVVDNSACAPNFHLKTDIDDYHLYRGIPESRREWDTLVAELAARPAWTFSPHGDADRQGDEPLVLSEYGNWGLPHALDQYAPDGTEPWWFGLGADWAFGAAEGTGLMRRFRESPLAGVFGTWANLVTALQRVQMIANRYQTGSIRAHGFAGYVLTQLSDVQWEANGLLDANRTPKQFSRDFALVNGDAAAVLRPEEYSVRTGGTVTAQVSLAGLGLDALVTAGRRAQLVVALGDGTPTTLDVTGEGVRSWSATVAAPTGGQHELAAELWVDGVLSARDAADILVVSDVVVPASLRVRATDDACARWVTALGLPLAGPDDDALMVTRVFDGPAQAFARAGGNVLVLAEEDGALADAFDYLPSARLGPRSGDGDWVPRNEWLDRTGHFAQVPGDTILGIAFEDLLGDVVVNGIPHPMRPARVHSGIFSGWLRGQATSTATVAWSAGRVTVTTFKLRTQVGRTPIADALGRAMILQSAARS